MTTGLHHCLSLVVRKYLYISRHGRQNGTRSVARNLASGIHMHTSYSYLIFCWLGAWRVCPLFVRVLVDIASLLDHFVVNAILSLPHPWILMPGKKPVLRYFVGEMPKQNVTAEPTTLHSPTLLAVRLGWRPGLCSTAQVPHLRTMST